MPRNRKKSKPRTHKVPVEVQHHEITQGTPVYHTAATSHLPAPSMLSKLMQRWHLLTLNQKIVAVIVMLATAGCTIAAIYYLAPSFVAYFEGIATNNQNKTVEQKSNKTASVTQVSLAKKPSFFNATDVAALKEKVKTFNVVMQKDIKKLIESSPYDHNTYIYKERFHRLSQLTKTNLIETIHPEVLSRILDNPNFSIQISHTILMRLGGELRDYVVPMAFFNKDNSIYLSTDIQLLDEKLVIQNLKNEIHSAGVYATNLIKCKKSELLSSNASSPFLDQACQIDKKLTERLDAAVTAVEEKTRELIDLFNKRNKNALTVEERKKYREFTEILKDFKPPVYIMRTSKSKYENIIKTLQPSKDPSYLFAISAESIFFDFEPPISNLNLYIEAAFLGLGEDGVYEPEVDIKDDSLGAKIQAFIRYMGSFFGIGDEEIVLQFRFNKGNDPLDKVKAFIGMHYEHQIRYASSGAYYLINPNRDYINSEKSSSYEELRPFFPKEFFNLWCEYFSEYHEVEDYCYTVKPTP